MACRGLWNTTSNELVHSDILSEIDFVYSTQESENKASECFICNGKFFEDERGEIWIKCFQLFSVGAPGLYQISERRVYLGFYD